RYQQSQYEVLKSDMQRLSKSDTQSNKAYQILHRIRKLNQNVVHILMDLRSDNLPTDRENLLRFISYQCNIAEYPDLEEAYCDKILTPDSR
ncbi:26041_t:CDS:2, partial [Racocetra persica]